MIELYQFCHCPYCIRVRLALGHLGLAHKSIVVGYDDADTPMRLIGKKQLPIVRLPDGRAMGESLDIIRALDKNDILRCSSLENDMNTLSATLNQVANALHALAIPYWVEFPEFDAGSRTYFLEKQKTKRGTLDEIIKNKGAYARDLPHKLALVAPYIQESQERLSILDIMLGAHLFPLYVINDGAFLTAPIKDYLQRLSSSCRFDYLAHIKQGLH